MSLDKYYLVKNIGKLFKGYSETKLNSMLFEADNKDTQDVKMVGWKEIKSYTEEIDIQDMCKTVKFSQKYNKSIKYMEKGDIIFPVISPLEKVDILYVQKRPDEMYLYDETVIVLRVINPYVDSRYIHIMMNSLPIKNAIINLKWENARKRKDNLKSNRIIPRLTVRLLSKILIVKLTEEERYEIVQEYEHMKKIQNDFENKLIKLQTQDKDKSAVIWFQDNKI